MNDVIGQAEKQRFRDLIDGSSCDRIAIGRDSVGPLICSETHPFPPSVTQMLGEREVEVLSLLKMSRDDAWSLPPLDRKRVAGTFRYVNNFDDLDSLSAESQVLVTNAIDLLLDDCAAELAMYREFEQFRSESEDAGVTRSDWLRHKRESMLQERKPRFLGMRRTRLFA